MVKNNAADQGTGRRRNSSERCVAVDWTEGPNTGGPVSEPACVIRWNLAAVVLCSHRRAHYNRARIAVQDLRMKTGRFLSPLTQREPELQGIHLGSDRFSFLAGRFQSRVSPERLFSNRFADAVTPAKRAQGIRGLPQPQSTGIAPEPQKFTTEESTVYLAQSQRLCHGNISL